MRNSARVEEITLRKLVRFAGLKAAGIVDNRVTLQRWIDKLGFPKPIALGENSIAWDEQEIDDWVAKRRADREAKGGARKAKGAMLAEARAARRRPSRAPGTEQQATQPAEAP
jgi:predicted DNA-binding transcriptional regulator AlpA